MAVKEESLQAPASSEQGEQTMTSETFYYSPWRFLRVAFAIAWSAFTHPFSSTVINLETGDMRHQSREERE